MKMHTFDIYLFLCKNNIVRISRRVLTMVACVAVTTGFLTGCGESNNESTSNPETLGREDRLTANAHVFMPVKDGLRAWTSHIGLDNVFPPNNETAAQGYDGFAVFGKRCMVAINFAGPVAASETTVEVSSLYPDDAVTFGNGLNRLTRTIKMGDEAEVRQMLRNAGTACQAV